MSRNERHDRWLIPHGGSGNGYSHYGCRCVECKEANRARNARRRAERYLEGVPATTKHGASTYANWGCRCDVCSTAWQEKMRANYARRKARRESE